MLDSLLLRSTIKRLWSAAGRQWRAGRHLSLGQAWARIVPRSGPAVSPWLQPPSIPCPSLRIPRCLVPAGTGPVQPCAVDGCFTFLNRPVQLGDPIDWTAAGQSREWLYQLHGHQFLWTMQFAEARTIVRSWIRHFQATGPDGPPFEPYPTSVRLINWSGYFFGRHAAATVADSAFSAELWHCIEVEANHLSAHFEYHLRANHLLENAAALVALGITFQDVAADRWLQCATHVLKLELDVQFLVDGVHIERSPMYQLRMVYLLETIARWDGSESAALARCILPRARYAAACLLHPDGGVALLNDAARSLHELLPPLAIGADEFPVGTFALAQAGYYGARTAGAYIVCDAGPIGPDYNPGHGHADVGTFELSVDGQRLIVDTGVYTYEEGLLRAYCRSTPAHNTVAIDRADSAEFWKAFRVGRRPAVGVNRWATDGSGFHLAAHHDGFAHLRGGPVHAREFAFRPGWQLAIRDTIEATARVEVAAYLHLHPACAVDRCATARRICIRRPGVGVTTCAWSGWHDLTLEPGWYFPTFGEAHRNCVLKWTGCGKRIDGCIQLAGVLSPWARAGGAPRPLP